MRCGLSSTTSTRSLCGMWKVLIESCPCRLWERAARGCIVRCKTCGRRRSPQAAEIRECCTRNRSRRFRGTGILSDRGAFARLWIRADTQKRSCSMLRRDEHQPSMECNAHCLGVVRIASQFTIGAPSKVAESKSRKIFSPKSAGVILPENLAIGTSRLVA